MSSRKKGKASLEDRREPSTGRFFFVFCFFPQVLIRMGSVQTVSILEACELFIKKVNDHCAEYKAGEYGEKTSNA